MQPGQSQSDYYKSLGYHVDGEKVENQDDFLARMSGIVRLFATICLTQPPPKGLFGNKDADEGELRRPGGRGAGQAGRVASENHCGERPMSTANNRRRRRRCYHFLFFSRSSSLRSTRGVELVDLSPPPRTDIRHHRHHSPRVPRRRGQRFIKELYQAIHQSSSP